MDVDVARSDCCIDEILLRERDAIVARLRITRFRQADMLKADLDEAGTLRRGE